MVTQSAPDERTHVSSLGLLAITRTWTSTAVARTRILPPQARVLQPSTWVAISLTSSEGGRQLISPRLSCVRGDDAPLSQGDDFGSDNDDDEDDEYAAEDDRVGPDAGNYSDDGINEEGDDDDGDYDDDDDDEPATVVEGSSSAPAAAATADEGDDNDDDGKPTAVGPGVKGSTSKETVEAHEDKTSKDDKDERDDGEEDDAPPAKRVKVAAA